MSDLPLKSIAVRPSVAVAVKPGPVTVIGGTGVSSFNGREGNVTLAESDVRPLVDSAYLAIPANATANQVLTYNGANWLPANIPSIDPSGYVPKSCGTSYFAVYDGDIDFGTSQAHIEVQDNFVQMQKRLIGEPSYPAVGSVAGINVAESRDGNNTKATVELMGNIDQYHWGDASLLCRKHADARYVLQNSLPVATTTSLGAIKVGANLTVLPDGTLNATGGGGGGMSIPGVTAGANMPLVNDMSGVNRADGFITGSSVVNGYNTRNLLATNLRFADGNSNEQSGIVQQTQTAANVPIFNMSILARQQSLAIYGETIANGTARNGYATLTVFPRNVNDLGFERAINELSWTAVADGVYPATSGEYTQRSKRNAFSNHRFRATANTTGGVSELLFQATPTNTTLTVKGTATAPMVFSGNSVLTQDYADTRYLPVTTSETLSIVVNSGNATYSRLELDNTGAVTLNASHGVKQTRLNVSPDQGVTLTISADVPVVGGSIMTRDYADTRYAAKVSAAISGIVEVDIGNGKTLVFTDGVLTEVRSTP